MKLKKVLFVANTDRHIILCHIPYIKMFIENGYEVHVITNTDKEIIEGTKKIKLSLRRNPFNLNNIKAIFEIRRLAKKEKYDIISCHTPIGGFLGRIACLGQKLNTKIFYIAHGFHFYKGSSLFSWLVYYNIEKFLSKYTTCILTMNNEDYNLSKNKFKCDTYKINGIGYDETRIKISNPEKLKKELGLENKYIVTYIAEISKRKNQKNLLKKLNKYDLEKENIVLLLIGDSKIKNFNTNKYKNIIYLDFKEKIGDYIEISNLIISPSLREGMPLNIIEAMCLNKFIIANDIRGINDIIINNKNGLLIDKNNINLFIKEIIKNKNKKIKINNNMNKYKVENVIKDVKKIYNDYLEVKLK